MSSSITASRVSAASAFSHARGFIGISELDQRELFSQNFRGEKMWVHTSRQVSKDRRVGGAARRLMAGNSAHSSDSLGVRTSRRHGRSASSASVSAWLSKTPSSSALRRTEASSRCRAGSDRDQRRDGSRRTRWHVAVWLGGE